MRLRIAHAVTVAAKASKLGRELSLARVGVSEMAGRPDDLLDAIRPIAQKVAVLLELGLRLRAVLPIRRIEGGLQVLAGVIEIEGLDTLGEDRTEVGPVVLRPIGELDQGEIGPLFEHRRFCSLSVSLSVA